MVNLSLFICFFSVVGKASLSFDKEEKLSIDSVLISDFDSRRFNQIAQEVIAAQEGIKTLDRNSLQEYFVNLVQERHLHLQVALAKQDINKVLNIATSVPDNIRNALKETPMQLEEVYDGIGDLSRVHCLPLKSFIGNKSACDEFANQPKKYSVRLEGKRPIPALVDENNLQNIQSSSKLPWVGLNIPLHGFIIDGIFVVIPQNIRCDPVASTKYKENKGIGCWMGKERRYFESKLHAHRHMQSIRRLRTDNADWTNGNFTMFHAVLIYSTSNSYGKSATEVLDQTKNKLLRTIHHMQQMSFGHMNIDLYFFPEIITVGKKEDGDLNNDMVAQTYIINKMGISKFLSYDMYSYTYPYCDVCGRTWAGVANSPGRDAWFNGLVDEHTMEHEFGHNLGLGHAGFNAQEYDDPFDPQCGWSCSDYAMGCFPDLTWSAAYKHSLHWFESKDVVTMHPFGSTDTCPECVAEGIFHLAAHDMNYPSSNHKLAIRVSEEPMTNIASQTTSVASPGRWAYFETRAKTELSNGVSVHRVSVKENVANSLYIQDIFTNTPTLSDAKIVEGDSWIYRGERHPPPSASNPYLGAHLLIKVVRSSLSSDYNFLDSSDVFGEPPYVVVKTSFLDIAGYPQYGFGCDESSQCQSTVDVDKAGNLKTMNFSGITPKKESRFYFQLDVDRAKFLYLTTCNDNTGESVRTKFYVYSGQFPPWDVMRYNGDVRAGALFLSYGCNQNENHATVNNFVVDPALSPYYIILDADPPTFSIPWFMWDKWKPSESDFSNVILENDLRDASYVWSTKAKRTRNITSGNLQTSTNKNDTSLERLHMPMKVLLSGGYQFYIASDEEAELWFNTVNVLPDVDASMAKKIAYVSGNVPEGIYDQQSSQESDRHSLMEGDIVFLTVYHRERNENAHLSVAIKGPGRSNPLSAPKIGEADARYTLELEFSDQNEKKGNNCPAMTYLDDPNCVVCPLMMENEAPNTKPRCKCAKGTYKESGNCHHCPNGTYQTEAGQTTCIECPSGKNTLDIGSKTDSDCLDITNYESSHNESAEYYCINGTVRKDLYGKYTRVSESFNDKPRYSKTDALGNQKHLYFSSHWGGQWVIAPTMDGLYRFSFGTSLYELPIQPLPHLQEILWRSWDKSAEKFTIDNHMYIYEVENMDSCEESTMPAPLPTTRPTKKSLSSTTPTVTSKTPTVTSTTKDPLSPTMPTTAPIAMLTPTSPISTSQTKYKNFGDIFFFQFLLFCIFFHGF